jgi:hypothetical protein
VKKHNLEEEKGADQVASVEVIWPIQRLSCNKSHHHLSKIFLELKRRFKLTRLDKLAGSEAVEKITGAVRHDVERNIERATALARLEHAAGISGTYFFRVASPDYNLVTYSSLVAIEQIKNFGHEVGLHSEAYDLSAVTGKEPGECLQMEISVLKSVVGDFQGVSPHRSPTGLSNLDWFQSIDVRDWGLSYQAYDPNTLKIFPQCDYLSDSHIYHWRRFRSGKLISEPECICEDLTDLVGPVYVLLHPHLWYRDSYYLG